MGGKLKTLSTVERAERIRELEGKIVTMKREVKDESHL